MTPEIKDAIKDTQFLKRSDGVSIAYHYTPGQAPCVVFLSGFKSDMTGGKAVALEDYCRSQGQAFLRFDYQGHGASSGTFEGGSIGEWAADAVSMLDHIAQTHGEESCLLVGSSMGGWIMLLAALQRKARIAALIGIAAAPDFTERLMRAELSDAQRAELEHDGQIVLPNDYDEEPYVITRKLLDDGRNHVLLDGVIDLDVPVRLIHGLEDTDVPWATAMTLSKQLRSDDVEVHLVKNGGHRLSEPKDLKRLFTILDTLLGTV